MLCICTYNEFTTIPKSSLQSWVKSKRSLLQSPFSLSLNYVSFNQSLLSILIIISIAENSVCTGEIWVSPFRFWQNLGSTLLEYGQIMNAAPLLKNGKICVSPLTLKSYTASDDFWTVPNMCLVRIMYNL